MAFRVIQQSTGKVLFECEDIQGIVDYIEPRQPWEPVEVSVVGLHKDY